MMSAAPSTVQLTAVLDQQQLDALAQGLTPYQYRTAISRAVNRSLVTGRKIVSDEIRSKVNLRAGDAKSLIGLTRATRANASGKVSIKHKSMPLTAFGARGVQNATGLDRRAIWGTKTGPVRLAVKQVRKATKKTGSGLHVKMWAGKPATVFPHGFVARDKSGTLGAWHRKRIGGKRVPRLPIKFLRGPTAYGILQPTAKTGSLPNVLNTLGPVYLKNATHEINFMHTEIGRNTLTMRRTR